MKKFLYENNPNNIFKNDIIQTIEKINILVIKKELEIYIDRLI
jgi:hypothetical protein